MLAAPVAHASQLNYVSDLIDDSQPATSTNHLITFGVPSGIPASGKIIIGFEGDAFAIDPSFGYSDVGLAVSPFSPSSGFVDRSVAATPDATNDGASIDGTTGPITITLSSGAGIAAGSYVQVSLGTNAPGGVYQIVNPTSTASYHIDLNTYQPSNAAIDYGSAMVAILPAIGTDIKGRTTPALLTNGLPSGTIPSNVSGVLISLNTDVLSTCRYSLTASTTYDSMPNTFLQSAAGTFHYTTVTGITEGTTYNFYVRCEDFAGNKNPTDYIISFFAGQPTGTGTGGGTGSGPFAPPSSGGGGGGGGGGAPFPPGPGSPSLVMTGVAPPNTTLAVLQDGKKLTLAPQTDGQGNFSIKIASLPQGTYTFTIEATNSGGNVISSYTTTFTIILGTTNSITGIVLPPSLTLAANTVSPGKPASLSGVAVPSSTISIVTASQGSLQADVTATTTANQSGAWSYTLGTTGFPVDTYQIKARSLVTGLSASNFSSIAYLGVGEAPVPKSKKGDLNGDGKVNLVDFSILLVHWGTSFALADLNGDGVVNLVDFSILLSNWTG